MEIRMLIQEFKTKLNRLNYLNRLHDYMYDLDYYNDSAMIVTVEDYQNALYEVNEMIDNLEYGY